jgi:hypothetical protein
MMIVGQISSPEEAKEVELIVKHLVVASRAKVLAKKGKNMD